MTALCIRCHTRPALGLVCDPCLIAGRMTDAGARGARATPCHDRTPATEVSTPEPSPGRTEASVQQACVTALRQAGWQVWRIGQRNARGTQDAGVPDCVALRERLLWIEFKRPAGVRQSTAQRAFQAACERAGVAYLVVRDVQELRPYIGAGTPTGGERE